MTWVPRQVWRSDTGRCVYEEAAAEGAGAGGQMTLLQAAPGKHALMAATTDCRLRFYASQACMLACCSVFGCLPLWDLRPDRPDHGKRTPGAFQPLLRAESCSKVPTSSVCLQPSLIPRMSGLT